MSGAMNPALALREALLPHAGRSFLRWDRREEALLVSDAPRHGDGALQAQAQSLHLRVWARDGLLCLDLPLSAYRALLTFDPAIPQAPWADDWFEAQSLLACLLRVPARGETVDEPLLRAAMLACAQGEATLKAFLPRLRHAHAEALRQGDTASCRACAALCAHWLWTACGIGLPKL